MGRARPVGAYWLRRVGHGDAWIPRPLPFPRVDEIRGFGWYAL